MSLKNDIISDVKNILDTKFDVEEVTYVPDITNSKLTYGNTGLQFEGTVLYVDMRGSTAILTKHNRPIVAKIHMAYFHAILKVAQLLNGEIRSFNGDSVLVFFHGNNKNTLNNAVYAAMQMTYIISSDDGINTHLAKYSPVNFGIGIDFGHILCTKIGLSRTPNNQDLIWIGHAVNKSTVISDKCTSPYHVGVASIVYDNLNDNMKYTTKKNAWGYEEKISMWTQGYITYNGQNEIYYFTNWYFLVN
jgi:class 3 adenylate cyclase